MAVYWCCLTLFALRNVYSIACNDVFVDECAQHLYNLGARVMAVLGNEEYCGTIFLVKQLHYLGANERCAVIVVSMAASGTTHVANVTIGCRFFIEIS